MYEYNVDVTRTYVHGSRIRVKATNDREAKILAQEAINNTDLRIITAVPNQDTVCLIDRAEIK